MFATAFLSTLGENVAPLQKSDSCQVASSDFGLRVDKFLAIKYQGLSRSYFQKLIRKGYVLLNGEETELDHKLIAGEKIDIFFPPPPPSKLVPEPIPVNIVYEDSDIIVVDKPAGLTVYPGPGHPGRTLINALLAYFPELASLDTSRPGIVHRLDKDTSGLMVIAKHGNAQQYLVSQFRSRSVTKGYLVMVKGKIIPEQGTIDLPIGRNPANRKIMAVSLSGREAKTHYRVKQQLKDYALLEVNPETGRTHQIRVHLKAMGYPVVGDSIYGVKSPYLIRQFVHAYRLGFRLLTSGKYQEFAIGLPGDLEEAFQLFTLRGGSPSKVTR